MRIRWRLAPPIAGVLLFAVLTKGAFYIDRVTPHNTHRYFWWFSIRLDPDPLNKHHPALVPCKDGQTNRASWDLLRDTWVEPGLIPKWFAVSALPAFVVGIVIFHGLGHLGVNEVCSFLISMPLLIVAWYYFIGWLLDRWKSRQTQTS